MTDLVRKSRQTMSHQPSLNLSLNNVKGTVTSCVPICLDGDRLRSAAAKKKKTAEVFEEDESECGREQTIYEYLMTSQRSTRKQHNLSSFI